MRFVTFSIGIQRHLKCSWFNCGTNAALAWAVRLQTKTVKCLWSSFPRLQYRRMTSEASQFKHSPTVSVQTFQFENMSANDDATTIR